MRDNSGNGDSTNNNLNPMLDEHAGQRGPGLRDQQVAAAPSEADKIVRNARERGEDPSPSDRARGETSIADRD